MDCKSLNPCSLQSSPHSPDRPPPSPTQHLVLTARTDDPTHYIWILELFEQLTLVKYNGRPHWGKNLERTVGAGPRWTRARAVCAGDRPGCRSTQTWGQCSDAASQPRAGSCG
jgi:hypothetical protein